MTRDLIRDLTAAFVDHPETIRAEAQEGEDATAYFMLKGHDDDESKLVGTGGSHVDALAFLIAAIGVANEWTYTFRLLTKGLPRETPKREQRNAISYDPEPARLLLVRILHALDFTGYEVAVSPGAGARDSLTFAFTIRPGNSDDNAVLRVPHEIELRDRTLRMALIDAIGTLFRAVARRGGVRFHVVVDAP